MKNYLAILLLFCILTWQSCGNGDQKSTTTSSTEIDNDSTGTATNTEGNEQNMQTGSSGAEPYTELWFVEREKALVAKIDAARENRPMEDIVIRGKILNGAGKEVTLDKLGGEERFAPISTTIVNDEGVFELRAQTNQPQLFQLRFDDRRAIPLVLKSGNYEVKADFKAWQDFTINSPESYILQDYFNILELNNERIEQVEEYRSSLDDYDHINAYNLDTFPAKQREFREKKFEELKNFIESHPSSIVAIEAANRLDPFHYIEYIKKVYDRSYALYPYSSYLKPLGKKLIRLEHLMVGQPAPNFTLPDLEGKNYALNDYRGDYVLLHVSTAYFTQCRVMHKRLKITKARFDGLNFQILGVSKDDSEEALRVVYEEDSVTWPYVGDLLGDASPFLHKYPGFDPPELYLISPEGNILIRNGTIEEIEKMLSEKLL